MAIDLFYPIPVLFAYLSQIDSAVLWALLIISVVGNFYWLKQNKKLKSQLKTQQKKTSEDAIIKSEDSRVSLPEAVPIKIKPAQKEINIPDLPELETAMDNSLFIDDDDILFVDNAEKTKHIKVEDTDAKSRLMHYMMRSLSGWHQSLVPFLLQNIGWFIGILCFISGSVFFVSYTEGFNKSLTIFYTVLSYTLLLAWAGYRLKDKMSHASMSGYVLMATSFLLVPLNFAAAAQLIGSSTVSYQYLIAILSTLIASGSLYFTSRLISGVFHRQLLNYFSPIFFALSSVQLVVPWLQNNQSMITLMAIQVIILLLLLWALITYMPALLKQVFVDRQYLLVMSVGSLIYAALVSMIHITISSPLLIEASFYAPIILLISAVLFYIDGQLNDYKERMNLLSYFSFIAYGVSFIAIALSLGDEPIRNLTLFMATLLYARLIGLYRSLAPLYLVITLLCFLHFDVILSDWLLVLPGISLATASRWYFLASLPLLGFFFAVLLLLRKSERQGNKNLDITRHLFHLLIAASLILSNYSQWSIAISNSVTGNMMATGFAIDNMLNLLNALLILSGCYVLLQSKQISADKLLAENTYTTYCYILLILPVIEILLCFQALLSMDIKLLLITLLVYFYSINSRLNFLSFYTKQSDSLEYGYDASVNGSIANLMTKELFINASLLISFFLLLLVAGGYSVSIKMGSLIFVIALNFLFLSLTLLNRALFYGFLMVLSVSILTFKLYFSHSPSTGLLLISAAFIIFYFIRWLDYKRQDDVEQFKLAHQKQKNPANILWFYPSNDFSIQSEVSEDDCQYGTDKMAVIKNV